MQCSTTTIRTRLSGIGGHRRAHRAVYSRQRTKPSVAYLYDYAGRPWRTQERLAQIVAIGRPFVDRAMLTLPNGRTFTVAAQGLSPANRYIGRVMLNGRPLERSVVGDAALRAGGELRFTMQATPNRRWATGKRSRPYSMTATDG